jgi:hypothetical protein
MSGDKGRFWGMPVRVRELFREDPDELLPREWVAFALLGSAFAVWMGLARDEKSGNPLLRWAADDFLLNVLAGLALVGPGLVLTNVIARRLAAGRRMAQGEKSLDRLLGVGLTVAAGVRVAHVNTLDEGVRSVGPVPTLNHVSFAENARELLQYLRSMATDLSRLPRPGESVLPAGSSLHYADESRLVQVQSWPTIDCIAQLTAEIDKLTATFDANTFDREQITHLDEALGRPYVNWQPSSRKDARFQLQRSPLEDGMLLSREEYAFAASSLAERALTVVESVIDILPRPVRSAARPGR